MKSHDLAVLLLVIAVFSASMMVFALNQASSTPKRVTQPTSTPWPSSTATSLPTQTATPSPKPTATPTPDPASEGSFGPKGYFRIVSPTRNDRYDGGNVTLVIKGEAINQPLFMAYSIDGQEKVLFAAVVKQAHGWDKFFGIIAASEPLPPLPSGPHTITVYGTLVEVSAQATVHFTVT
jgi:hypothetical protein